MKRFIILVLAAVLCLAAFASCAGSSAKYTVGICQLVEHDALDAATKGFKDALTEKLGDQVKFDEKNAQGESTNCITIVNSFVTSNVDLIMANATPAVIAAKEATDKIPVIGTSVTDYVAVEIVDSNEKPGHNVTGASDNNPVTSQVDLVKAICPDAKIIGIVYCSAEPNSKVQAEEATAAFEAAGFEVKTYTIADTNDIQNVVTKACAEVDAFYEPSDNVIAANVAAMSAITTAAKKPVFACEESMVKNGFLASYSISYYDLGYQAGLMAYEILANGKNPADMPIFTFSTSDLTLVINEENQAELGITIPDSLKK